MKELGIGKASRQLNISCTTLYKWQSHFEINGEQRLIQKPALDKNPELGKLKEPSTQNDCR
jgi:transposase